MPIEETLFHETLLTFATAMVPVLELRGAIPVGVAAGLSPAAACAAAILGNMVPVPFIMLLIRRIFELKMLVINGEYPDMFHCCLCHKEQNLVMYSAVRGGAVCHTCAPKVADGITIGGSTVYTMQYIICSPIEKLYTFRVTEQVLGELSMVMNRHFDRYVDKKFKTLDILQMMVENIK